MTSKRGQTIGEEIANSITHGLGLVAALAAAPVMIGVAARSNDPWRVVTASLYATTLVLLYAASTVYHAVPAVRLPSAKLLLKRLDHAAIYLLIAGTYTPFLLVNLRGPWGWSLFGVIWGLAALGITLKSVYGAHRLPALSTTVYVAMGWLAVIAVKPMFEHVPHAALLWLAVGGVCYTLGVAFYVWHRLRYHHAIWHLFVLAGSAAHAWAVLGYVLPARG
ncbi:MAG: hemolysin III family protein [Gemmatimonadetes bacterium]|nr:hemolysin III family protein [Gemmatimonadota bacterium]